MKNKSILYPFLLSFLCLSLTACNGQAIGSETPEPLKEIENSIETADTTDSANAPKLSETVYTYTDIEMTKYSLGPFNFRDLPTRDGKVLGRLTKGFEITVTGQCNETEWYRFEYEGNIVYIDSNYVSDENPLENVADTLETTETSESTQTTQESTDSSETQTPSPAPSTNYWTWTASNGYTLKLKNEYANSPFWSRDESWLILDQDTNYRPDSEYMRAHVEFFSGTAIWCLTPEEFFMSPAGIPLVEMPSEKLTAAESTPSWEAFCNAFNPLWTAHMGYTGDSTFAAGRIYINNGNNVILYPSIDAARQGKYEFYLTHQDNGWTLNMLFSMDALPSQLMWCGIQNALRLVTPDAEALYQQFYDFCYGGNHVFPAYDTWVPVGNSQAMVEKGRNSILFHFK